MPSVFIDDVYAAASCSVFRYLAISIIVANQLASKTESPDQKLFRHISQRSQNTGLDCCVRLCTDRDTQKRTESAWESPPDSPKSERNRIRESSNRSITYETASRFARSRKL